MDEQPINAKSTEFIGQSNGDSTVAQTVDDVRAKASRVRDGVTYNKDGTPRKKYGSKGSGPQTAPGVSAGPSAGGGTPGFTEEQVKASFKGLFSLAALGTDCNVWFLQDSEADCFVPSTTLALNQIFPSVAQSKWGALSLASLSLLAVVTAKTLAYLQYKASLKPASENNGAGTNVPT